MGTRPRIRPSPKIPALTRFLRQPRTHQLRNSGQAKTDYLEFEGRPHLSMVGEGWEEVAAGIDSWLDGVLDAPVATTEAPPS